jgi:hypothetical protein
MHVIYICTRFHLMALNRTFIPLYIVNPHCVCCEEIQLSEIAIFDVAVLVTFVSSVW